MAKKSKDDGSLFILVGAVLFLPFLLVFFFSYKKLEGRFLDSPTAIRVIDIKHCMPSFISASATMVLLLLILIPLSGIDAIWLKYFAFGVFGLIFIASGTIAAKHLAVRYLGFVADKERDSVTLAFDMESYGILDYVTLQFVKDFCNVDSIALSEITRLSRGRGVELYIHGDFGSRSALFSSKQKRDEALAIIKELNSSNTKMMSEIESY